MEIVQVRIDYEEGRKGGYYNYEFGYIEDNAHIRYTHKHVYCYVDGPFRYEPDDDIENAPEDDWRDDRCGVYVYKSEIKSICFVEE